MNLCITEALMNVLLNSEIILGDTLNKLKCYSQKQHPQCAGQLKPEMKSRFLSEHRKIRDIHNTLTRKSTNTFVQNGGKQADGL
ncbi:unnamed protein product [Adineta steineri]|uniref:UCH catalytic domain-containing protein n=1 Tax=Adineta steineri TaxID=433720 RepID=A0A819HTD5_9BILA|nr:unnamed protein product [Adineta steineri]CAF3907344.1 unnamed protein product [Adineta steineri]